jgi:hypothetical protein
MRPDFNGIRLRKIIILTDVCIGLAVSAPPQSDRTPQSQLKQLSSEQLGALEVITQVKAPQQFWKTAARRLAVEG